MGYLPPDTRCGWCGWIGAGYLPDGIDPPVPLCEVCLWGYRDRAEVMFAALNRVAFWNLQAEYALDDDLWRRIASFL